MKNDRRELWTKRVECLRDSGLSAKEFAGEIGVNPWTIAHWKWRMGAERRGKLKPGKRHEDPTPQTFVEITPGTVSQVEALIPSRPSKHPKVPEPEPLEFVLHSGLRIRVPVLFDAGTLRGVVAVLEGRCHCPPLSASCFTPCPKT
jgi:hypothetical protein